MKKQTDTIVLCDMAVYSVSELLPLCWMEKKPERSKKPQQRVRMGSWVERQNKVLVMIAPFSTVGRRKLRRKLVVRRDSNGLAEQDWSYIWFNDFVTIRRQAGTGDREREIRLVLCCLS